MSESAEIFRFPDCSTFLCATLPQVGCIETFKDVIRPTTVIIVKGGILLWQKQNR
jgi:hypothetical protein